MNEAGNDFFDEMDAPIFDRGRRTPPANNNDGLMFQPSIGGMTPVKAGFREKDEELFWVDENQKEIFLC